MELKVRLKLCIKKARSLELSLPSHAPNLTAHFLIILFILTLCTSSVRMIRPITSRIPIHFSPVQRFFMQNLLRFCISEIPAQTVPALKMRALILLSQAGAAWITQLFRLTFSCIHPRNYCLYRLVNIFSKFLLLLLLLLI